MKIIQTKTQKRYNKAKQNVQAILIAFICLASFVAILAVDRTEAQSTLNCNGSNFCSKVDDEASPFGEITEKEQTKQTQTPEKTQIEKCEDFIKNEIKLSKARCDDIIAIGGTFNWDKTIIAIIIYESGFNRQAVYHNKDKNGRIWSSDRGVYQINDHYHPELDGTIETSTNIIKECIRHNGLNCWSSYKSKKYKQEYALAINLINAIK